MYENICFHIKTIIGKMFKKRKKKWLVRLMQFLSLTAAAYRYY